MRKPRTDEISTDLGLPEEDIAFIINATESPTSLDLDLQDDEHTVLMDLYEDYTYNPERALLRKSSRQLAIHFLDNLKDKEKRILMYRYQLGGGDRCTLKKIGDKMGLSPETVRQIELRALAKMRTHADELKNCL
jgi:RNA polymerase primary sigma factor